MSQSQPAVLMIGADPYAIRACLRNRLKPVVVHGPGVQDWGYIDLPKEAKVVFAENPASLESVLSSLERAGLVGTDFLCVQSSHEMAQVTAAALAELLGAPAALEPGTALRFRDKWLQKQAVSAVGVPVARSQVIDDIHHLDPAAVGDFETAVLKPIAGAGTRNTSVVHGVDGLVARCAEHRRNGTPQRTFVLEEFIAGDEWMIDGVVFDGELEFFSVRKYAEPCLSIFDASSLLQTEVFDPVLNADVYARARSVAEPALRSLGLRRGVFHMELFHQEDTGRLVFGECAARAGGELTHEVIECKFGVDLGEAAIRVAAGMDPQIKPSVRAGVIGSTFLATRPGILVGYPNPAEMAALPGVEYLRLEIPYGSTMAAARTNTMEGAGQVLVTGSTPEEFRRRRDFITQWFDDHLIVVPPDATNQDLRRWQRAHWPESASSFRTYPADGSVQKEREDR